MKGKIRLFRKALGLVWDSAPGWATVNIVISVLQSFLPLDTGLADKASY